MTLANMQSINTVIGSTQVFLIGSENQEKITFTSETISYGQKVFRAWKQGFEGNEECQLGYVSVDWLRVQANGHYGSPTYIGSVDGPLVYYRASKESGLEGRVEKICIRDLKSLKNTVYKGVGTALIEVVMEYYLRCQPQFEGRIMLHAVRSSHPFYYKLGFITLYENDQVEWEKAVRQSLEKNNRTEDLGSYYLCLSQTAIKRMKEKIQKNPILLPAESEPSSISRILYSVSPFFKGVLSYFCCCRSLRPKVA